VVNLYVNRAPVRGPWGGGNMFVQALYRYAEEFDIHIIPPEDHFSPPDAALVIALDDDEQTTGLGVGRLIGYKLLQESQGEKFKLILRVNENDARKATRGVDDLWCKASEYIDATIWVSNWLQSYYGHRWKCQRNSTIINGVDREIFKLNEKIRDENLAQEAQRLNIVAHHWSNNALKGFDIYEAIDQLVGQRSDDFTFTYIGRHRSTFKNSKVIGPLSGRRLGEELGKYDVYVSASRFDPGPNHILEALACQLPTYVHKDGGGAVEFVNDPKCVFDDFNHLVHLLDIDLSAKRANCLGTVDIQEYPELIDWKESIRKYCEYIKEVCNE
jgi:glycosyltransferase involved in cell wall biosynthesis